MTAAQGCSVSILQECDEIFNHETEVMKTMDGSLYYCSALPEEENKNHIPFSSVQNQKMLDFIYIKEK